MATRLQRARETLKREEKKSDLKRLKEARSHLQAASEFLKAPLHDSELQVYADKIKSPIAEFSQQLKHVIAGEKQGGQPEKLGGAAEPPQENLADSHTFK